MSAANAGIAMAARPSEASAASLPVVDMHLLLLGFVIGANPGEPLPRNVGIAKAGQTAHLGTPAIMAGLRPDLRGSKDNVSRALGFAPHPKDRCIHPTGRPCLDAPKLASWLAPRRMFCKCEHIDDGEVMPPTDDGQDRGGLPVGLRNEGFTGKAWFLAWGMTCVTAVALLPLLADAAVAQGRPMTVKLATATLNDTQHEWMKRFAAMIGKNSGGRLAAELYPASQLGLDSAHDRRHAARLDPDLDRTAGVPGRRQPALRAPERAGQCSATRRMP